MLRERMLKIVLVVVGLLFCAGIYPLAVFFSQEPSVPMIMSIYVTLGIFLLLAVRDPAANRSLIAFGGWANLAHAAVMAAQEYRNVRPWTSSPCPRSHSTSSTASSSSVTIASVSYISRSRNIRRAVGSFSSCERRFRLGRFRDF